MSSTVKSFSVGYNPVNESNTFSSGDCLTGQVTIVLAKDCKVDFLSVKLKGKAEVRWTERRQKRTITYYAKEKYFSLKQFILKETSSPDGNTISAGSHAYPFTFQIPAKDMPSSHQGAWGKIVYTLDAKLNRSMRLDSNAHAVINFLHKTNAVCSPELMVPQHGAKHKKTHVFSSGAVAMDVNIDKMGYQQGEGIRVLAAIQNNSSRDIKPKYCVYMKQCYYARGKRRMQTKDLLKDVGEPIPPSTSQTVTKVLAIPPTMAASILNCNIIKVEHRLRVYLDVKYASDPDVKLPIIILPASRPSRGEELPHPIGLGVEAFGPNHQSQWSTPPQHIWSGAPPHMAPGPMAPPPPYHMYNLYPPPPNSDGSF